MYDPERLRQMFSQLQAYNAIDGGAGGQVASPYGLPPGSNNTNNGPGSAAAAAVVAAASRVGVPVGLWTSGNVAHLQSPVFTQEAQANPFGGPSVFSEFAGGFGPSALGDYGRAGAGYAAVPAGRPQQAMHHSFGSERHGSTVGLESDNSGQPPGLEAWREKLFHVKEVLVLTQQQ